MRVTIGKENVTSSIPGQMHIRPECDLSEKCWTVAEADHWSVSCNSAAEALRREEDVPSHPLSLVCPYRAFFEAGLQMPF